MNKSQIIKLAFLLIPISIGLGCEKDTILPPAGTYAQRYVQEITEANLSGQGGDVTMPSLEVAPPAGNAERMPLVLVYGDKRSQDSWTTLETSAYYFTEGLIHIDASTGDSSAYRIVVLK